MLQMSEIKQKENGSIYSIFPSPAGTESDCGSLAATGCAPRTLSKKHLVLTALGLGEMLWRNRRGCSACPQKACAQPFGNHLNYESASFSTVIFSLLLGKKKKKGGSAKRGVTLPAKRTWAGLLKHLSCTFTHISEQSLCGN